jgi:hypothetical protein
MGPRAVIEVWVDAFNRRDAAAAAAQYHEEAVTLQVAAGEPIIGRQAILEDLRAFFHAFPDNYTNIENLFEDGEWAILEWSGGGTWRGKSGGYCGTKSERKDESMIVKPCVDERFVEMLSRRNFAVQHCTVAPTSPCWPLHGLFFRIRPFETAALNCGRSRHGPFLRPE